MSASSSHHRSTAGDAAPNSAAGDPVQKEAAFCSAHGVQISRAADYGWLVRKASNGETGTVLGCIDQSGDRVELMELDAGFHWSPFASVHDALEQLLHDIPQPGDERRFDHDLDQTGLSFRAAIPR